MNKIVEYSKEINTTWIENLALEELNMDESGEINIHEHLDPRHYLEESSIDVVDRLRDHFEIYTNRFNEYRGGIQSGKNIKIFKISNTVNDFMLFRNSLRLIVARKASDLISIGFLPQNENLHHELKAHVGPFNQIKWKFQGEEVDLETLVKYYTSDFVRNSAR